MPLKTNEQLDALTARCVDVVSRDDLAARLSEGRPLNVKLGIDPSGPMLHLGHAVVLRRLRAFQDLGHQAILVVGDFTAQIGDPTGRTSARKPRTREQIEADMKSYAEQAGSILDIEKAQVVFNSTWLGKLGFADVIGLVAKTTVARMLERDDFSKRYAAGTAIGLDEFLYPIAQAYDSVALNADVELGGTEQLFNLMMGRRLQEDFEQKPQVCVTLPILEGTDGVQRMGKSLSNFIALCDLPNDMFGKIMSIPDALLERYWRLATTASDAEIAVHLAAGPREAKMLLAKEIVALYHGRDEARSAFEHFTRTVVNKELPTDIPTFAATEELGDATITRILVTLGLARSNRDAQRLVEQGAIRVSGERIDDPRYARRTWHGAVVQKGNHQFFKIE